MTPTADVTSSTLNPGTQTIIFTATNAVAATISSIKLVSAIDSTSFIDIPANSWTSSGSGIGATTSFSATVNAGSYLIKANTQNGYIAITTPVNVNFPTGVTPPTQDMSFNGGTFTITGNNLSPASYIEINGFKGVIQTYTSSAVTYKVPPIVTTLTQSTFSLVKEGLLDKRQFTYFSDQPAGNQSYAFDGLTATFYGSSNAECYFGMDAGAGMQA